MNIIYPDSVYEKITVSKSNIYITSKHFPGFRQGVNKPEEYSWFYILSVSGKRGEKIIIHANLAPKDPSHLTRSNSLAFYTQDFWQWRKIIPPVWTNYEGLKQKYTFVFPSDGVFHISNTMFFSYSKLIRRFSAFVSSNSSLCRRQVIGQSLDGHDLFMISFTRSSHPRGRILITSGCHPAEPDILGSIRIIKWLASPAARSFLNKYQIDLMPMQNPDGFINRSCLTSNGINLYWNFHKDDKRNCPEAYYLWQNIKKDPPFLYLDFHTYVHQYHRHPMPYLQSPACYQGAPVKSAIKHMDKFLIKSSGGYYRLGNVSMWPTALSTYITSSFNSIAYTKYHLNLYEGVKTSQDRALNILQGLLDIAASLKLGANNVLSPPFGQSLPDYTDSPFYKRLYRLRSRLRQILVYAKSYYRYYRYRNRTGLYD